jgi:MFS family permease
MNNKPALHNIQEEANNDPIASRIPFFYGWLMVFIAITAYILSSPAQTYGISVFNPFLRQDLNLSHSQISGAYMLGTFFASLPMFLVGLMTDRYGLRRTMTLVVILFGIACVFMSQVTNLIALFFAFFMLRLTGQGSLGLLAGNTGPMWFLRRLGKVTGVANVIVLATISIIPALFLWMINAFTWRTSYLIFAVVILVVMMPLLLIFFRNRPEDIGQNIDGALQNRPEDAQLSNIDEGINAPGRAPLNLKQAIRTRSYWLLMSMSVLWAMTVTAIIFHLIPLFEHQGLTKEVAVGTFTTFALSAAGMQLFGGFLADRYRLNILLVLGYFGLAFGLVILILMRAPWMGHTYALIYGASDGLLSVVIGTIWVRYYGRLHLGKIRGTTMTALVFGSSIGPFLMGYTFDQTASYSPSLIFFLVCSVIMGIALWFATPPHPTLTPD